MAVQAQYPSNILLFSRNDQERKNMDYTTQPAGFLDQPTIFFPTGGSSNTRKRGREAEASTQQQQQQYQPINLFSLQSHPQQQQQQQQQQPSSAIPSPATTLINLSQLHHQWPQQQLQPNSLVSTGLCLFEDHHQTQHQNHLPQPSQQQQQTHLSSFLDDDVAAQIKLHKDEIDRFLLDQSEQLRRTLAESRRRHYSALLSAAEESVGRRLREKEAELERVARRNADLESRVARLRADSAVLQAKARADEATAVALQAQLHQAAADRAAAAAVEDPSGSDNESACVDPRREEAGASGAVCRGCGWRAATVVVLPCRHLCICRACEPAADACPVCFCVRSATVEVYLS